MPFRNGEQSRNARDGVPYSSRTSATIGREFPDIFPVILISSEVSLCLLDEKSEIKNIDYVDYA